jgi:hypothetical protein
MSAGTAHRPVGVGPRGGPVEIRTCKEGIGSPEFPCNQAGITGVLLKTNGNAVSPDPSGVRIIFLRKRFTSADIRCSMVAGGADAAKGIPAMSGIGHREPP